MKKCVRTFISPVCFLACLLFVISLIIIMDSFFVPSTSILLAPNRGIPLLNFSNFEYLVHNDVCDTDDLKAVLIITSHAGNARVREAHRVALPKTTLFNIRVRRVFLLALSQDFNDKQYRKVKQSEIVQENKLNSDIIQGNFLEAYKNLTYKHIMGLQWVTSFCRNAQYVIKMDDDIIVDVYRLLNLLPEVANVSGSFMLGYVLNGVKPSRNPSNKWFVKYEEYPRSFYPPFLSGWMYVTTPSVATEIIDYTQRHSNYSRKDKIFQSFFWIDDLFVTGIIAQQLKVQLINISRYYAVHPQYFLCCIETALIERLKKKDEGYVFPCDYVVGPSGGNLQLFLQVLEEARNCWRAEEKCQRHLKSLEGSKKCTVGRAEAYDWIRRPFQEGKATLEEIRL